MTSLVLRYSHDDVEWEERPLSEADVLIGRTSDCDLQLDNPEVSRYHASLKVTADGVWLTDMGSTNGTYIEDEPLTPNRRVVVQPGQNIIIGPFRLVIEAPQPAAPALDATMVRPSVKQFMYDVAAIRQVEFPNVAEQAYLNNAAVTPIPMRVREKIVWNIDQMTVNPAHETGAGAFEMYGRWLTTLAQFVNAASPEEIVIMDSVSTAANAIAQAVILYHGDNLVLSTLEYPAFSYPFMARQWDGAVIRDMPMMSTGVTVDALERVVDSRTRVVAASSLQFFTGHRTDLAAVGDFCRDRGILFVVDAIQNIGHTPIDVQAMNIDVLITGAHKSLMSGTGLGFMYVREGALEKMRPRLVSGMSTQNWTFYLDYDLSPENGAMRFSMGTPNIPGMHGMIEAVGLINEMTRPAIDRHTTRLAAQALDAATNAGFQVITPRGQHGSIVTFESGLDAARTDALITRLAEQGVIITKHLDKQAVPHLRVSVHGYNTEDDIAQCFAAIQENIDHV